MGSYNSQYESYYSTLVNKRKNYKPYKSDNYFKSIFNFQGNFIIRRIMIDLIGVFVLFAFAIGCKLIVTPQTTTAYRYAKIMVNKNYDYKTLLSTIKSLNISKLEERVTDSLENLRTKITGAMTLKNKIKADFDIPVEGAIISQFGERNDPVTNEIKFHEGIDINTEIGVDIINPYEGKVKNCGENEQLGKYVIIDHGKGIETKYGNLNEILVKKDDILKKNQVLGKVGSVVENKLPHLHFELLYMGENKNPEDFINFKK